MNFSGCSLCKDLCKVFCHVLSTTLGSAMKQEDKKIPPWFYVTTTIFICPAPDSNLLNLSLYTLSREPG
jgi:hypothetical protein